MPVAGSMTPSCSSSQRSAPRGLMRMESEDSSDRGFSIWEKPEKVEQEGVQDGEKKGEKTSFSRWAMSDSSLSPTFSPTSMESHSSPFSVQGTGMGSSTSSPTFGGEGSGRPLVGMDAHMYFTHEVSQRDSLVGLAIRYGVEVGDIKRANNLMTDHQIFARKTLRIPLLGSHLPSPVPAPETSSPPRLGRHRSTSVPSSMAFGAYEKATAGRIRPRRTTLSPAMGMLRGYYGLPNRSPERTRASSDREDIGTELAVYKSDGEPFSDDDGLTESIERRGVRRQQSAPPLCGPHDDICSAVERGAKKDVHSEEEDDPGRTYRRRKSQVEEVAAVIERLAASVRDMHVPDGIAGEDGGHGVVSANGEGEVTVSDKVVRRRGRGDSGEEEGCLENGDSLKNHQISEIRGSIPSRGPMPKGKRGDGQPFSSLNGWHNIDDLGDGGKGKAKVPGGSVRRIKAGEEGIPPLVVPSPTLAMAPMLGVETGSGAGTPLSMPDLKRTFSGEALSALVQKISPRLGENGFAPKKKTAVD